MDLEELFVGAVAITLGLLALTAAARNSDWCFRLHKIRWIEARWGRRGARLFYALLGVALIGLGLAIARGYGPNKGGDRRSTPRDALPLGSPQVRPPIGTARIETRSGAAAPRPICLVVSQRRNG